uniref:Dirigent protein n=1 Tax=Anopheles atroparvus TaxID=41427 RepID=A0AAG5DSP8_ANOAO
ARTDGRLGSAIIASLLFAAVHTNNTISSLESISVGATGKRTEGLLGELGKAHYIYRFVVDATQKLSIGAASVGSDRAPGCMKTTLSRASVQCQCLP